MRILFIGYFFSARLSYFFAVLIVLVGASPSLVEAKFCSQVEGLSTQLESAKKHHPNLQLLNTKLYLDLLLARNLVNLSQGNSKLAADIRKVAGEIAQILNAHNRGTESFAKKGREIQENLLEALRLASQLDTFSELVPSHSKAASAKEWSFHVNPEPILPPRVLSRFTLATGGELQVAALALESQLHLQEENITSVIHNRTLIGVRFILRFSMDTPSTSNAPFAGLKGKTLRELATRNLSTRNLGAAKSGREAYSPGQVRSRTNQVQDLVRKLDLASQNFIGGQGDSKNTESFHTQSAQVFVLDFVQGARASRSHRESGKSKKLFTEADIFSHPELSGPEEIATIKAVELAFQINSQIQAQGPESVTLVQLLNLIELVHPR